MITDAGLTFWDAAFGKPPEQVQMDPADKEFLERALIFEHRPDVSRVIFISTPHRGSVFASNWIGRIGIALVKLPVKMVKIYLRFENCDSQRRLRIERFVCPRCGRTLSVLPKNRLPYVAVNTTILELDFD